jgi:hypothetical protein
MRNSSAFFLMLSLQRRHLLASFCAAAAAATATAAAAALTIFVCKGVSNDHIRMQLQLVAAAQCCATYTQKRER